VNGITAEAEVHEFADFARKDLSTAVRYQDANDDKSPEVVLYEVRGGGFTEPSKTERYRRL
jgi:hypothetical protein